MDLRENFSQITRQQMYEHVAQVAIPTLIAIKKAPDAEVFKYDFSDGASSYELPVSGMFWTTNMQANMTDRNYQDIVDKASSTIPIDIMSQPEIEESQRLGLI